MISRLFVLNMKALLSGVFKIKPAVKKSGAGKTLFAAVVGFVVVTSIFAMFIGFFNAMLEPYFSAGIGWMYFAMFAIMVFALCVISTIFTGTAAMFGAKDNELLLSMPIKPSAILISRLLVLLTYEYVLTLIIASAAFILWVEGGYATAAGILFFMAGVILLPPMALSVSILLAWVLGLISSRLRYKNIITLLVSVGFLVAYLYFYMNAQGFIGELVERGSELAVAFRAAMPPFYAFGIGVANGNAASGLSFILWAVLPFTATLLLLGANYQKVLTSNRGSLKIIYREKQSRPKRILFALTAKEMARLWSKPVVIMNSTIGSIFMIIAPMVIFIKTDVLSQLLNAALMLDGASPATLFAVMLALLGSINSLSASLVSLEGKSLWIVKSLPVSAQTVLRSKVLAHLLSSSPPCLFASVCIGVVLAGSLPEWLLIVIIPQTIIALVAVMGLALNLHFPKLDWNNEVYVVKQGMSAMVTMFGIIGILIGLGLVYILALTSFLSATAYLWICGALFCLVSIFVYTWLMKAGARMFAEL
ncbi:MAG: hypothetical protein LBL96_12375 [Clostridiales bacterium]|jgi:ABC-2 type transport system permease protein|nr:hypothetical protein [Clostridiales bacterium]